MESHYTIVYETTVIRQDIPRLDPTWRRNVQDAIEEKLMTHPELFGKPLRQSLKGHRALRVGDYRIAYRIENTKVKIFAIGHRSYIYEMLQKRL